LNEFPHADARAGVAAARRTGFREIDLASKGIRVNQLAKELGVESKAILTKLRDEGLGEKAPNHMSVLPLGLAESVREWFTHLGGGTAVETAAPVAVDVKPKRARTSAKKKAGEGEHDEGNGGGGDSNAYVVKYE
jgi:translation initiation factor IF-2